MYYLRQFIEALLYPLRALLTSPGKVTSSARRLAAISLPARISILVAMFLVFVVFAVYFAFLRGDSWSLPCISLFCAATSRPAFFAGRANGSAA
jgi:hypothetical protein